MSILQRAISALSVTIVSAVVMVAGKRYVLFKFTRRGIRSRRVAIYANPSIGNLARYLVCHGFELPLLVLLATWVLGLATGLTVNDIWTLVPAVKQVSMGIPSGSFDEHLPLGSRVDSALGLLTYVMGSVCTGVAGTVGLIEIGNLTLASGGPMGTLFYPPLPSSIPNSGFSFSTTLNALNISMEPLSTIPSNAQGYTCAYDDKRGFKSGQLWYETSRGNHTLSIIANTPTTQTQSLYRFKASAITLGGTLNSNGGPVEFLPNGTAKPLKIHKRWGEEIAHLVCNATFPPIGNCSSENLSGSSLVDFSILYNNLSVSDTSMATGLYWSTALGMAMGAYSSAWYNHNASTNQNVTVTLYDSSVFTVQPVICVLIANIVVSVAMLVAVTRLRLASRLGGDFINAPRLLLDPLKNPELFNETLDATMGALGNPYMMVNENNEFLLVDSAEQALSDQGSMMMKKQEM